MTLLNREVQLVAGGAVAATTIIMAAPHAFKLFRRVYCSITKTPNTSKYTQPGHKYIVEVGVRQTPELKALHEATFQEVPDWSMMCSPPDAVAIHQMVARLVDAKKVVEVGVFTGYTALGMALVLPKNGKLVACDVHEQWPKIGKPFWEQAGVAEKIELRIGPAADTLRRLIDAGEAGTYDLAFIDADKVSYDDYFELCYQLVRRGGVIMVDNVKWPGVGFKGPGVQAIDALNRKLHADTRVDICMLANSDGVTLARKR